MWSLNHWTAREFPSEVTCELVLKSRELGLGRYQESPGTCMTDLFKLADIPGGWNVETRSKEVGRRQTTKDIES